MKTVNYNLLEALLYPLAGEADDDDMTNKFLSLDIYDDNQIKEVIKNYFYQDFINQSLIFQSQCEISLAYYLITEKISFTRIIQSSLLPFDPSPLGKKWFLLMWEIYFGDKSYNSFNISDYIEIDDPDEVMRLLR